MLKLIMPLLLSPYIPATIHQSIISGFNLRWVLPQNQNGQVALSVGSAAIDGSLPITTAPPGVPASAYFPNDSPPITPTFPPSITPILGETYVAYCYILLLSNGVATGAPWWESPTTNDFKCMVGAAYRPTPNGHATTAIPYTGSDGNAYNISAVIFVGSVVGIELAANTLYYGNPAGFSVLPFFRNGSQIIYATDRNTCSIPKCLNNSWDLGIPTTAVGIVGVKPIPANSFSALSPAVDPIDFTIDGAANPVPLSASAIILESEAYAHEGADTMCFLDPNQPGFGLIAPQSRSCQSEQQLDTDGPGTYRPLSPFRTHVNIGQSTTAGNGYGEIWIGGFCSPNASGKIYFDLSYRGYIEPERQLVSQLPVP
jgi:hypothetical protein